MCILPHGILLIAWVGFIFCGLLWGLFGFCLVVVFFFPKPTYSSSFLFCSSTELTSARAVL